MLQAEFLTEDGSMAKQCEKCRRDYCYCLICGCDLEPDEVAEAQIINGMCFCKQHAVDVLNNSFNTPECDVGVANITTCEDTKKD